MFHPMRFLRAVLVGPALSAGLLMLTFGAQADAACGIKDTLPQLKSQAAGMIPALYQPGAVSAGRFLQVSDYEEEHEGFEHHGIVGLWQFKMSGFSVDWGTQAWHADGTEFMFSGAQNPQTGDVCQGVWRKVGPSTYTLNHIALAWLAPGAGYGLRIHFHMVVKLHADGHSFSGNYKAQVFSVSPSDPFDESVQVASGTGAVTARRVNPD
jgi:hypothetical protein